MGVLLLAVVTMGVVLSSFGEESLGWEIGLGKLLQTMEVGLISCWLVPYIKE